MIKIIKKCRNKIKTDLCNVDQISFTLRQVKTLYKKIDFYFNFIVIFPVILFFTYSYFIFHNFLNVNLFQLVILLLLLISSFIFLLILEILKENLHILSLQLNIVYLDLKNSIKKEKK